MRKCEEKTSGKVVLLSSWIVVLLSSWRVVLLSSCSCCSVVLKLLSVVGTPCDVFLRMVVAWVWGKMVSSPSVFMARKSRGLERNTCGWWTSCNGCPDPLVYKQIWWKWWSIRWLRLFLMINNHDDQCLRMMLDIQMKKLLFFGTLFSFRSKSFSGLSLWPDKLHSQFQLLIVH